MATRIDACLDGPADLHEINKIRLMQREFLGAASLNSLLLTLEARLQKLFLLPASYRSGMPDAGRVRVSLWLKSRRHS